jgi:hypothetical protein
VASVNFAGSAVARVSGHAVNNVASYRFTATVNTSNLAGINPFGRISLQLGANLILKSASTTVVINSGFAPAVFGTNFTL